MIVPPDCGHSDFSEELGCHPNLHFQVAIPCVVKKIHPNCAISTISNTCCNIMHFSIVYNL